MIWVLLVIYQIKHFLADYPLQGSYMLGKFKALSAAEYVKIASLKEGDCPSNSEYRRLVFTNQQRIKNNTYFWWALGADQMAHHLTHYAIIAILVSQ